VSHSARARERSGSCRSRVLDHLGAGGHRDDSTAVTGWQVIGPRTGREECTWTAGRRGGCMGRGPGFRPQDVRLSRHARHATSEFRRQHLAGDRYTNVDPRHGGVHW